MLSLLNADLRVAKKVFCMDLTRPAERGFSREA